MKNMVVSAKLTLTHSLNKIPSNKDISYNIELFPAALIHRWRPAHVALFHNGSAIITGIKSLEQAEKIICELNTYVHDAIHLH